MLIGWKRINTIINFHNLTNTPRKVQIHLFLTQWGYPEPQLLPLIRWEGHKLTLILTMDKRKTIMTNQSSSLIVQSTGHQNLQSTVLDVSCKSKDHLFQSRTSRSQKTVIVWTRDRTATNLQYLNLTTKLRKTQIKIPKSIIRTWLLVDLYLVKTRDPFSKPWSTKPRKICLGQWDIVMTLSSNWTPKVCIIQEVVRNLTNFQIWWITTTRQGTWTCLIACTRVQPARWMPIECITLKTTTKLQRSVYSSSQTSRMIAYKIKDFNPTKDGEQRYAISLMTIISQRHYWSYDKNINEIKHKILIFW